MLETAGPEIWLTPPSPGCAGREDLAGRERLQELSPSSPVDGRLSKKQRGKWAVQPEGGEAAWDLSSEPRPCPHDPDLRPPGCHQRKHKKGWGQGPKGSEQLPFTVSPHSQGNFLWITGEKGNKYLA